jgi:hypothetical protein
LRCSTPPRGVDGRNSPTGSPLDGLYPPEPSDRLTWAKPAECVRTKGLRVDSQQKSVRRHRSSARRRRDAHLR